MMCRHTIHREDMFWAAPFVRSDEGDCLGGGLVVRQIGLPDFPQYCARTPRSFKSIA